MIRKHKNSVAPGCGVDGSEGENFTKRRTDPWHSSPRGNFIDKKGVGAYTSNDPGLTNQKANDDFEQQGKYTLSGDAKDIWDAVEGQSSDSGNRAVKSGNKD